MNNTSMHTADRLTHLKIVVVSLVAGIVVVGVGIAARPTVPDMSTQLEARAPILKAGQPVIWSGTETTHASADPVSTFTIDFRAPVRRAIFLAARSRKLKSKARQTAGHSLRIDGGRRSGRHVADAHQADGVELGLLAGGRLGALAHLVALVEQLDLLELFEGFRERLLGVVELALQLVGGALEVLAALDRRLGVGRIGEMRADRGSPARSCSTLISRSRSPAMRSNSAIMPSICMTLRRFSST